MQYKESTVSVTNGSATVTGYNTLFVDTQLLENGLQPGFSFKVKGDPVIYTIASVSSNTTLVLSAPYQGITNAYAEYQITTDYTPFLKLAEISAGDQDWASHLTIETIRKLDAYLSSLVLGGSNEELVEYIDQQVATKQAADPTLSGIASVPVTANTIMYATGVDQFTTTPITPFARTLLDDNDASAARTTLGVDTIDLSGFVHDQQVAINTWVITHNLGRNPIITIYDTANNQILGDIEYTSADVVTIKFTAACSGKARLL